MKFSYKILGLALLMMTTTVTAQNKAYLDKTKPIEERVRLLMNEMTLEENRKAFDEMCELLVRNYDLGRTESSTKRTLGSRIKDKLLGTTE